MTGTTYEVHVERVLDAPVERVWRAWTTPEDLRSWWGPAGFSCPRAEVDLRPGGSIRVTMRAPAEWGGFQQHSRWDITEIEAPRLLRYVFRFVDDDGATISPAEAGIPDGVPDAGEHEVVLAGLGEGWTALAMSERGYASAEARDLSRAGLEQCLDKMADLVARPVASADPEGAGPDRP